jgi:hypothetical protein
VEVQFYRMVGALVAEEKVRLRASTGLGLFYLFSYSSGRVTGSSTPSVPSHRSLESYRGTTNLKKKCLTRGRGRTTFKPVPSWARTREEVIAMMGFCLKVIGPWCTCSYYYATHGVTSGKGYCRTSTQQFTTKHKHPL